MGSPKPAPATQREPSGQPRLAARPDQADQSGTPEEAPTQTGRSVPAWLVSMIVHIIVLLLLALWTTPLGQGIQKIALEFGEAADSPSVDLEEFAIESSDAQFDEGESEDDTPVDMNVEQLLDSVELVEPIDLPPMDFGGALQAELSKPMFGGRSGAMKSALLAMYGGNEETMTAVERGLRWLARQQDKKRGSWSMRGPFDDGSFSENHIAATAMALLAFQGDGNTHRDGPYRENVEKGLKYLLSAQSRRTGFFAKSAPGHERAYSQAQATIAICELYAMTKDSALRPSAQAAIDYALDSQSSQGGWRYEPRTDSDLSITGWYVMALTSAKAAGLDVPDSTLAAIDGFLDSVQQFSGAGYSYQTGRPASPAMTAEGLLCRQYLGWEREREAMGTGIETLVLDWPIDPSDMDVYYWYYGTQAVHHYGGPLWEKWNSVMKAELPRMQVKRGNESGSWSPQPDEWGRNSGRLYTTCMSIFCLEVYYRHLPLYQVSH